MWYITDKSISVAVRRKSDDPFIQMEVFMGKDDSGVREGTEQKGTKHKSKGNNDSKRTDTKIKDSQLSEQARRIAKNKISFIRHLITYVAVILVLALINNVTHAGRQWWLWVALFWGIGVFFNFLNAFIFKGGGLKKLEEEMTQKELERLKNGGK